MRIFRAITGSGDWTFGSGRQGYLTGDAAIAADIKTSLLFFLNDFFASMNTGIDWWNLIGAKQPYAQAGILLQTRQTILGVEGVVRINAVVANFVPNTRRLSVSYNIDTIYSPSVTGSITTP